MPIIIPANSAAGAGGFSVANSVMFDDGSSSNFTDGSAPGGNRQKFTWSAWVKRSSFGATQILASSSYSGSDEGYLFLSGGGVLGWQSNNSGDGDLTTAMLFRDTNAWYHIVFSVDTTQSTAANRIKLYINGSQYVWDGNTTYPNVNQSLYFNVGGSYNTYIGRRAGGDYFDGYMSEVVFIDNAQLAADSFGEFDSNSGVWRPLESVADLTFGTSGYYLNFQNSGALGTDVSGVGNTFSANNLAAIDQKTDTCTNNFTTWNFIADNQDVTFSEGDTKIVHGTNLTRRPVVSSFGVDKGKWYWEWEAEGSPSGGNIEVGIINYASPSTQGRYLGQALATGASYTTYIGDGTITVAGSATTGFASYSGGNVIGVAVDVDNERIYFYKDGSLVNSGGTDYSNMLAGSGFIFMSNADRSGGTAYTASVNFGQPNAALDNTGVADDNGFGSFEHTPPSGFLALCTTNISETNS